MRKTHFAIRLAALVAGALCSACSDQTHDTHAPIPAVAVTLEQPSFDTAAFTITPEEARRVFWLCYKQADGPYSPEQVIASGEEVPAEKVSRHSVNGLEAATEYRLKAVAVNAGRYAVSTTPFTTGPEPPPTVAVEVRPVACGALSLSFTITPGDARRCRYAIYEKGAPEPDPEQLLNGSQNIAPAGEVSTQVLGKLRSQTTYTILAVAQDRKDNIVCDRIEMTTGSLRELVYTAASKEDLDSDTRNCVTFSNDEFLMTVDFHNEPSPILPAGTFQWSDQWPARPGVFEKIYSYILPRREDGTVSDKVQDHNYFKAGTIRVQTEQGSTYTLDFDLILENDSHLTATYRGPIEGIDPDAGLELTPAVCAVTLTGNNYYFKLSDLESNPSYAILLDLYGAAPEGVYALGEGFGNGVMNSMYSAFVGYRDVNPPGQVRFQSARTVVTSQGAGWVIEVEGVLTDNTPLSARYAGPVAALGNP